MDRCEGDHELYVAEVVGLESQGKIVVVTVCRHCDRVRFHEHNVGTSDIRLLNEEKEK